MPRQQANRLAPALTCKAEQRLHVVMQDLVAIGSRQVEPLDITKVSLQVS